MQSLLFFYPCTLPTADNKKMPSILQMQETTYQENNNSCRVAGVAKIHSLFLKQRCDKENQSCANDGSKQLADKTHAQINTQQT